MTPCNRPALGYTFIKRLGNALLERNPAPTVAVFLCPQSAPGLLVSQPPLSGGGRDAQTVRLCAALKRSFLARPLPGPQAGSSMNRIGELT